MPHAVFSSDRNPIYMFYLPLVAMAWRRLGYAPIIILERAPWTSPREKLVLSRIGDGRICHVTPVAGYRTSTTMQTVRLLAACLEDIDKDTYILTSDVDMIVFDGSYFAATGHEVDLFGADAYRDLDQGMPPKFPLCYLGAKARVWRDVMGIKSGDPDIEIIRALDGRADAWDNDEMYFASRLMRHNFFEGNVARGGRGWTKGKTHMIKRGWEHGRALSRLDRDAWNWNGRSHLIDCHGPRPGWTNKLLQTVLVRHFPHDTAFINRYFHDFRRTS